jgi:hypothetical protein
VPSGSFYLAVPEYIKNYTSMHLTLFSPLTKNILKIKPHDFIGNSIFDFP